MKHQTSILLFGMCIKVMAVCMIVAAILATILRYLSLDGLNTFNSIFQIF